MALPQRQPRGTPPNFKFMREYAGSEATGQQSGGSSNEPPRLPLPLANSGAIRQFYFNGQGLALPQKATRRYLLVINNGTTQMLYLGFGFLPSPATGLPIAPGGGYYEMPMFCSTDAIYLYGAQPCVVCEG